MENLVYLLLLLAIAGAGMIIVSQNIDDTNPAGKVKAKKLLVGGFFLVGICLPLMAWSQGWIPWGVTALAILIATIIAIIYSPKKEKTVASPTPPVVPPAGPPTGPNPVSPPQSHIPPSPSPVAPSTSQSQRGPGRTTFGEDFGDVMRRFAWLLMLLLLLWFTWMLFGDCIKSTIADWRKPRPAVVVCPPCPTCPKVGDGLKEGDIIVTGSTSNKDFDKVSYKKKKSKIGGRRKLSGSEIPIKFGKKEPKNSSCPNGRKMRK